MNYDQFVWNCCSQVLQVNDNIGQFSVFEATQKPINPEYIKRIYSLGIRPKQLGQQSKLLCSTHAFCTCSLIRFLDLKKLRLYRIYRFSAKHGSKSLCLHKENGSWYIIKKKTKEHCSMGARVINPKNTAFLG